MVDLVIAHLYPETLRLNGEVGNVLALEVRAQALGLDVKVLALELGQPLPTRRPNIVFLGSGTLSATKIAAQDLENRAAQLHKWVSSGTKVLAVGSGFDLISQGLKLQDGTFINGVGLTNTTHTVESTYLVGEVDLTNGLAGFINSNRSIARGSAGFEIGTVRSSDESRLLGYLDGYKDGKVLASNVQGPLLPMNPKLADEFISWVYPGLKNSQALKTFDGLASKARKAISVRVGR